LPDWLLQKTVLRAKRAIYRKPMPISKAYFSPIVNVQAYVEKKDLATGCPGCQRLLVKA